MALTNYGLSQTVKVMTYNLRYDNPDDGLNSWDSRKVLIANQVSRIAPDFLGTQEGLNNQVRYLSETLKNYSFVGVGREDGVEKGEYAAIFYRSDRYKVIKSSTFWLSATPDVHSVGWDAALERICTYGLFQNIKTGKRCWIFNTHLDHIGKIARKESAKLILERINQLNVDNYPVILTGDFNSEETDEPIVVIKAKLFDTFYNQRGSKRTPKPTFNGFNLNEPAKERIDYIFINQSKAKVKSHITLNDLVDNRYPSDHFPVVSVIKFK